ncbi:MAG: hypothetical protein WA188_21815 [Terriglobales bacterium]
MEMLRRSQYGKCQFIAEENANTKLGVLRVHLPKPHDGLPVVVGDFLFNVRCALDYVVWQLVLRGGGQPRRSNQFPISRTAKLFEDAVRRGNLDGVPEKAQALIESLQPYHGGNEPLGTLAHFHNIDKHQELNLVTAVARDANIEWRDADGPFLRSFLGGDGLRDGAVFGGIGLRTDVPAIAARFRKVKVEGEAAIFVAFDDPAAKDLEPLSVGPLLQGILEFVEETVVPGFEPFFD